jgi:hypothetical protein
MLRAATPTSVMFVNARQVETERIPRRPRRFVLACWDAGLLGATTAAMSRASASAPPTLRMARWRLSWQMCLRFCCWTSATRTSEARHGRLGWCRSCSVPAPCFLRPAELACSTSRWPRLKAARDCVDIVGSRGVLLPLPLCAGTLPPAWGNADSFPELRGLDLSSNFLTGRRSHVGCRRLGRPARGAPRHAAPRLSLPTQARGAVPTDGPASGCPRAGPLPASWAAFSAFPALQLLNLSFNDLSGGCSAATCA